MKKKKKIMKLKDKSNQTCKARREQDEEYSGEQKSNIQRTRNIMFLKKIRTIQKRKEQQQT